MGALADPSQLRDLELFQGLAAEQLAQLNQLLRASSVPTGTHFITADQPGDVVYVLLAGTVKIYVSRADGREVILAFLGPGDTVGEMSLVDSAGRSANVVTTEASRLLWMDRASFQSCLRTMSPLANNLVRLLSHRLRFANEQIQALCTLDVPGRVARQILALADRYGSSTRGASASAAGAAGADSTAGEVKIQLRLTQSDLGEVVGASRERVNQAIVEFKQQGYIAVDSDHRIHVRDRQALTRYCL
ncbi:MAG TPA: Crp/Fnr family transcriptional regulator [Thermoanaerobaculia bacterium]|nr:Crp/Fnr family transcriptional regulator [Thermoanaerobaculia bacterium]